MFGSRLLLAVAVAAGLLLLLLAVDAAAGLLLLLLSLVVGQLLHQVLRHFNVPVLNLLPPLSRHFVRQQDLRVFKLFEVGSNWGTASRIFEVTVGSD